MITTHLLALQVVLPLIGAPLCILLRRGELAWALATLISWASLVIAALLLQQVLAEGAISYALGSWAVPWGIEYRVDAVSGFVLLIVAGIGAVSLPFTRVSAKAEIDEKQRHLFYGLYLLVLAGLLGIAITGDAFNLFVFLEISSLASYALIALGRDRRALTAAFRYLVMGTIGATFFLIGVGFLYITTGTLNIGDMAARLEPVADSRTVLVALAFLIVGLSLKLAMFPLHLWLPNAYTYAPSAVTVLLAATATKVAVYALLRVIFTLFGTTFAFEIVPLAEIFLVLALLAIVTASIVAVFQNDIKRMLAYSSIAQIGYIVLGISLVSVPGLTASLVHLFNHALMKGALFMCMGNVLLRTGSVHIDAFRGLGRTMPLTMFAFVIAGLSLLGMPLTVGFISKWYLVQAALNEGWWPVAIVILASSLIVIAYIWRVVEAAYFQPPPEDGRDIREAPLSMLIPTWILAAACVYFGIDTSLTLGVAERAAGVLWGTIP